MINLIIYNPMFVQPLELTALMARLEMHRLKVEVLTHSDRAANPIYIEYLKEKDDK